MKGIIVAKDGSTIRDDPEKHYVDTTTPLFKLYDSGKGTISLNAYTSPYYFTIPHNLGYVPMFFLFADFAPYQLRQVVLVEASNITLNGVPNTGLWTVYRVDEKYIYVVIDSSGTSGDPISGDYGYNYLIFYDRVDK